MERIKRQMENARKQREALQQSSTKAADGSGDRRAASSHASSFLTAAIASNFVWVFLGTAIGISVTMIAWWSSTSNSTVHGRINDSPSIITHQNEEDSRTNVTVTPNDNITQLNGRVQQLIDNVSDLEVRLMRIQVLADSIDTVEHRLASVIQQQQSTVNDSESSFDLMTPPAAGVADTGTVRTAEITPTHTVNAKLNLRPSASLHTTPLGQLPAGSKVEKISENDDWYFVNTQSLGKGWCHSSYLSTSMHTLQ